MTFRVRWPNQAETSHYSPSLVIEDHLSPGRSYDVADFLARSTTALGIASDRVKARYGMPCGRAIAQCRNIERLAAVFDSGHVTVLDFQRADRKNVR